MGVRGPSKWTSPLNNRGKLDGPFPEDHRPVVEDVCAQAEEVGTRYGNDHCVQV